MGYVTDTRWDVENISRIVPSPEVEEYLDSEYVRLYKWRYGTGGGPMYTKDSDGLITRVAQHTFKLCQYLQANDINISKVRIFIPTMLSEVILSLYLDGEEYPIRLYMLGYYKMVDCVPKYNVRPMGTMPDPYRVSELVGAIRSSMGHRQCIDCHYSNDGNEFCGLGMQMHTLGCRKLTPRDHAKR